MPKSFTSVNLRAPVINKTMLSLAAVVIIIIAFSIMRIRLYGDPALSIAGNDTQSYIESSQSPLFSAEILTGRRLLTTNLVYKLFEPETGYQILVNGSLETRRRKFQPGFDGIVIFQLAFSILGWGMLAYFIAENLQNTWIKISSAILILAFGYTPHIADWDSILMSESLTFSLFALQFALLIKMAFLIYRNPKSNITLWAVLWGVTCFFWTFLRDTNLFTSLMTLGMIAVLFAIPAYRKNKTLAGIAVFLSLIFILGFITAEISVRSSVQLLNLYKDDILPHPARVAALQEMGMPVLETPEFEIWLHEHGASAMARFMLSHPGYPAVKILSDFPHSFEEIEQTYFTARDLNPHREILIQIGDILHPENSSPFFLSLLMLGGLLLLSTQQVNTSRPWAWLGIWLFATASFTLIPTILGDTWALNRHALYSTTIYRLAIWLFPLILIDIALPPKNHS